MGPKNPKKYYYVKKYRFEPRFEPPEPLVRLDYPFVGGSLVALACPPAVEPSSASAAGGTDNGAGGKAADFGAVAGAALLACNRQAVATCCETIRGTNIESSDQKR